METWRNVWRKAVGPILSTSGLEALRQGLVDDDPCILQGATTSPPPLGCVQDWDVEGACPISYAAWKGDGLATVGEVEECFRRCCSDIDQVMEESAACRHFLNWADETPRDEMRRELLVEVELELSRRLALEQDN